MAKPKRKKTELGRTLAKVRIDFDETGADMAKKLGISASQMFNIEVGLAQVGYEFIAKVKRIYEIDLSEIMKRGGFMSKITLDLDELTIPEREYVLMVWSRINEGGESLSGMKSTPLKDGDSITLISPTVMTSENTPVLDKNDKLPEEPVRRPKRPPSLDDDIVFLDEDGVDDINGITEVDVL